ncbi:malate synthase A [Nocardioides sp. AN3]
MTVRVVGPSVPGSKEILTAEALAFVESLQKRFSARRDELLLARSVRRDEVARTGRLDFLPATAEVRAREWTVAPPPERLRDRRVEITGPTSRKMTINALNSGAKVWLADLEDANTPHWANVVDGQANLRDAVRGQIAFTSEDGKEYALRDDVERPVIVMRPRGWHFDDVHVEVDGRPVVAALLDFGLYFFHNAAALAAAGEGPFFYLPKMESHLEARLWNDVFTIAQAELGIPHGTVRATALIETIPAAFEMDEILYELRDHAAGLNAGRWDYLFSIIKYFRDAGEEFVLPDRNVIAMTSPFMRAYAELLVQTCHRRGAHAIGGMAAFIPSRRDADVNTRAFAKVREDKEREAGQGFDGSWVAHPDLVPVCREAFDAVLGDRANQVARRRPDVTVTAADLLDLASTPGAATREGLRGNVEVALLYLDAWLRGNGAVGIHNLMEDAATAEISRSQIWQWIVNGTKLDSGEVVTRELVRAILDDELDRILAERADDPGNRLAEARDLFGTVVLDPAYVDFLTVPAYALVANVQQ